MNNQHKCIDSIDNGFIANKVKNPKDLKMILNESRTTFDKLNESIHKLNDKINLSHLKK